MNQTLHSYGIITKVFKILFSFFGFFYPIVAVVRIYSSSPESLKEIFSNPALLNRFLTTTIALWFFLLPITLITAYYFSDIVADEDGLIVEFLWLKLRVKWSEIISIKPSFHWGVPTFGRQISYTVLTNSLTPLHRLYGLLYGRSPLPALVINQNISDYDLLVKRIEAEVNKRIDAYK